MNLDVLVFSAHPDDAEISAGGTIRRLCAEGRKVGIVDLTRGELGTRGTPEIRMNEAEEASRVLGICARENLGLPDGFFADDEHSRMKIIETIRRFQPEIVLCNSIKDRHTDHGRASKLVEESAFLSGLLKIDTGQQAFRPSLVLHYIQDHYIEPDIIIDITDFFQDKMKAIQAYSSQFFDPLSKEPETPISGPEFLDHIKGRAVQMGRYIGVRYGEGFTCSRPLGVRGLEFLL